LFDHRVAVLSVFLYLFCDPLLDSCVAGLPTAFLGMLFMMAVYSVFKAEKWSEAGKSPRWVFGGLAVAALAVGMGTLTQYAFVSVLVPLLVYVCASFRKQKWPAKVGLCLAVFLVVLSPWVVRNWLVSRTLFGLARLELTEGVRVSYAQEIKPGQLQRTYGIASKVGYTTVIKKLLVNSRVLYETTLKDTGGSYLIAFFLASLLHRFRRDEVFRLRRLLFWTLLVCIVWLALSGPPARNPLTMFMPLIIIYGSAFFFVLFERLQFRRRWERRAMVWLFALLNMASVIYTILPPARAMPYPPYDGGVVSLIGWTFRDNEVLASDIPWAVAWYADRTAVWAPYERNDFQAFHLEVHPVSGVYLTQATPLSMSVTEQWSGYQAFWTRMFRPPQEWRPPDPEFPAPNWRPMTPDGMQVLLSNRPI
jgi:hypothetical protein